MAQTWDRFFGPAGLGPFPEKLIFPCCAQFAVTKERIKRRCVHSFRSLPVKVLVLSYLPHKRRPRSFYLQALHFILNNELGPSNQVSKAYMVGEMFERYGLGIMS